MDPVTENLANLLSTLTITSCLILKVPQIMTIINRGNADGIYLRALLLELASYSITFIYNYVNGYNPMTYLEYPIVLVQLYILIFLVLKYKKQLTNRKTVPGVVTYLILVFGFIWDILPITILSFLVPLTTPLSGSAKIAHMQAIVQTGNADAVSLTTWIISVATNAARIFTVWVDSGDVALLFNFIVSTVLSLSVLVTAYVYKKHSPLCCDGDARKRRRSPPPFCRRYFEHEHDE